MASTPVTAVRLDPKLRKALEEWAEREGRTLSNAIQFACARLVEADKKQTRK